MLISVIVSVFLLVSCGSTEGTYFANSDLAEIVKSNDQGEDDTPFVCLCPRLGLSRHTIPRELPSARFEGLDAKTEWMITHDHFYRQNAFHFPNIIYSDLINYSGGSWSRYYGTYNGWVVVVNETPLRAITDIIMGNKNFFFPTVSSIWAWKQDDTGRGSIHPIRDAYVFGLIPDDDIQIMHTIHQTWKKRS
jgi:hypothetical protein